MPLKCPQCGNKELNRIINDDCIGCLKCNWRDYGRKLEKAKRK